MIDKYFDLEFLENSKEIVLRCLTLSLSLSGFDDFNRIRKAAQVGVYECATKQIFLFSLSNKVKLKGKYLNC
jgi:hypothetical protein